MTTKTFGMFTDKGNFMVNRIVAAGERLAAEDGAENAWRFAERELRKLATADEFGEATDTDVRDQVHGAVTEAAEDDCNFYL
jgi:hypothetical protein|tara:strand:- start:771 stop:1016 length:246 start_codon:yes stop_codon:yes gene_type:complete